RLPPVEGFGVEEHDGLAPGRPSTPPQRRCPRAGPCHLLAVTHRHRTGEAIALEPSLERDVAGIRFPLWRDGEAERAVGELDLRDRPRAAAGSDELSDQGGGAGSFHLE